VDVRDAAANARGAVISAAAFEYAISDLHLPLVAEGVSRVESLDVAYGSSGSTSAGTRLSIFEVMRGRWLTYRDGALFDLGHDAPVRRMDLGRGRASRVTMFPGGEVLHAPITQPGIRHVRTWITGMPSPALLRVASLAMQLPPAAALARRLLARGGVPSEADRAGTTFSIVLEVNESKRLVVRGTDAYGVTGKLLAEMAVRLERGEARRAGFTSPAAALDAAALRREMESWGVTCANA
jgi:hypothetical protein